MLECNVSSENYFQMKMKILSILLSLIVFCFKMTMFKKIFFKKDIIFAIDFENIFKLYMNKEFF